MAGPSGVTMCWTTTMMAAIAQIASNRAAWLRAFRVSFRAKARQFGSAKPDARLPVSAAATASHVSGGVFLFPNMFHLRCLSMRYLSEHRRRFPETIWN
jgi:aspartyl-tRNA synthetase